MFLKHIVTKSKQREVDYKKVPIEAAPPPWTPLAKKGQNKEGSG